MPAPHRIQSAVFLLVSVVERDPNDVVRIGRVAGRVAMERGLLPMFPMAFYMPYMTEEELSKNLPEESRRLLRRCGAIWICEWAEADDGLVQLDRLSYRMLLDNEGLLYPRRKRYADTSRVPVYHFSQLWDGTPSVRLLSRSELAHLLRCNIVTGLLQGAAA